MQDFIYSRIVLQGKNPYTVRFRTVAHNTVLAGNPENIRKLIRQDLRQVLSHDEAASLPMLTGCGDKLELLGRLKGYMPFRIDRAHATIKVFSCYSSELIIRIYLPNLSSGFIFRIPLPNSSTELQL